MAWALLGVAAQAQSVEQLRNLSLQELGQIDVTSVSRRPEPLAEAAAAVYVITTQDIRRSGARSLPEVLRLAPNLEVARLNAHTYTITARGFNSPESANKLLVMIDGRSVYSPLGSTVFWETLDVDIDDVERIEVISGPGGTLYGANAVNGVINVITKPSSQTQGGLADLGAGNQDGIGLLRYGGKIPGFGTYRVYGTGFGEGDTLPVLAADRSSDAWHGGQVGFRADGRIDHDALMLQGDLYKNQVVPVTERAMGGSLLGRWTRALDAGSSLSVQAYYSDDVRLLSGLRDALATYDAQAQYTATIGIHQLVAGAGARAWREGIFTSGPFFFASPEATLYLGNVFAQDEVALRPNLKLTFGSKLEVDSLSGLNPLPTIRLGWSATPGLFLWSAASRAVRTPSRIDRQLQAPGFLAPSPNFQAETLDAFEVGLRAQPLPNASFSLSAYYNIYDRLRTDDLTNGGLPIVLGNGLRGDTYGIEFWGTYGIADWWRLRPGLSWLHKNLSLKPGVTDFSQLQAAGQDPSYQAFLRSEMNLSPTVEFDLAVRDIGPISRRPLIPELVPSYFEMDARIAWRMTKSIELSIDGENLLQAKHLEAFDPSTAAPRYIPRSMFVRLRTNF